MTWLDITDGRNREMKPDFEKDLEPLISHVEQCLMASNDEEKCWCRNQAMKALESAYKAGLMRASEIAKDRSNEASWADSFDVKDTAGDVRAKEIAEAIKKEAEGESK